MSYMFVYIDLANMMLSELNHKSLGDIPDAVLSVMLLCIVCVIDPC